MKTILLVAGILLIAGCVPAGMIGAFVGPTGAIVCWLVILTGAVCVAASGVIAAIERLR